MRLRQQQILGRYALLFLLSRDGQDQLLRGRTAVAQPNINAGVISSVRLPVPSLPVLERIVAQIEKAFAALDKIASDHSRSSGLVDRLERVILAKAIRGAFRDEL
jgi:restriction endonuclease S subunit